MSEDLHQLTITGRLGSDPELKNTQAGSVLKLRVASNARTKGSDGTWGDATTWYSVSLWGKRGEALSRLLSKGRAVACSGDFVPREYTDKSGATKVSFDLNATSVVPLGPSEQRAAAAVPAPAQDREPWDEAF